MRFKIVLGVLGIFKSPKKKPFDVRKSNRLADLM